MRKPGNGAAPPIEGHGVAGQQLGVVLQAVWLAIVAMLQPRMDDEQGHGQLHNLVVEQHASCAVYLPIALCRLFCKGLMQVESLIPGRWVERLVAAEPLETGAS